MDAQATKRVRITPPVEKPIVERIPIESIGVTKDRKRKFEENPFEALLWQMQPRNAFDPDSLN